MRAFGIASLAFAFGLSFGCSDSPAGEAGNSAAGAASGGSSAGTGGAISPSAGAAGMPSAGNGGGGTSGAGNANGAAGAAGAAGTSGSGGGAGAAACPWPKSVKAVVSLNYDDGLDTQLAEIAPLLDARGLKASFFLANYQGEDHNWALPNLTSPLNERHKAWQQMLVKGHELSAHSVKHPCDAGQLASYTVPQMETELDDNIKRLERLGAQAPFTFGYPCLAEQGVGNPKQDFGAAVQARFIAARKSPEVVAKPLSVDLYAVPNLEPIGKSAQQLKALVDDAIAQNGWIMFGYHGVGAEKLSCPQGNDYAPATCMLNHNVSASDAHVALLDYLVEKKTEVWVATFKEAVLCFESQR